jgi:hypothetical protein
VSRLGAFLAALVLAGCAFSSEHALFAIEEGMAPIADGALYDWRPSDETDEDIVVRFKREGAWYQLEHVGDSGERPIRVLFVGIPETPQNDYIAQVVFDPESQSGFVYAFLWPVGEGGFRVFIQPTAFDDRGELHEVEGYCAPGSYGACAFNSAEDLRRYYRNALYPAFRSGHTPARYLDLTPIEEAAARRKL